MTFPQPRTVTASALAHLIVGCCAVMTFGCAQAYAYGALWRESDAAGRNTFPEASNGAEPRGRTVIGADMTSVQHQYVGSILSSMLKVIVGGDALENHESILGKGVFRSPKNPRERFNVSINFAPNNFDAGRISLNFSRVDKNSPWRSAGILVVPDNFPFGLYSNNLPIEILNDYQFEKSFVQLYPYGPVKRARIFEYTHKNGSNSSVVRIETREDFSSADETIPKNFFHLSVSK